MERIKFQSSIIICHHFGNLIYHCLNSLDEIQAQKIVVTTDEAFLKPANDISVLYLIPELNQPTFKRNHGAKLAKSEYLVFMDDDVEIKYNCIKRMEEYLNNYSDVGMVYALLYKMDEHNKVDTAGSYLSWCGFLYETYCERIEPVPILSGKSACCMIRRSLFEFLNGFDEDFVIYGEETDLSWRVWLAGYKVIVLPSAIGYHAFETIFKSKSYYNPFHIHYHGSKNYITMLIKNLPARKLYIALINAFLWFIVGCCLWFRNKQGGKWIMQGIWYNIKYFPQIWQKRKKVIRIKKDFYKYICKNPSIFYYFDKFLGYLTHRLHG